MAKKDELNFENGNNMAGSEKLKRCKLPWIR